MDGVLDPTLAAKATSKVAADNIDDPNIAAKFAKLAPQGAQSGSPEAINAFKQVTSDLKFDGPDAGNYAGKSLVAGKGGRHELLDDTLKVAGKSSEEASRIGMATFHSTVNADIPGDSSHADKVAQWKLANPK